MGSRNVERLRLIFARRVYAFVAEPILENFNRYRIASLALVAVPSTRGRGVAEERRAPSA
jgi:hypothetical protein